jgi:single-strand DNA-binding protein
MQNINVVVLTGNLTRDPELREFPSGGSVCSLRLAVNGRRKNPHTGEWEDQANYFDVSVFGAHGENCARYLAKGRPVAIDGRLRWREFTRQDGSKGQAVDVVADTVQFLGGRDDTNGTGSGSPRRLAARAPRPGSTAATSTPHRCRPGPPARTTSRSDGRRSHHERRAPRLRSQAARRRVPGGPARPGR